MLFYFHHSVARVMWALYSQLLNAVTYDSTKYNLVYQTLNFEIIEDHYARDAEFVVRKV